MRRLLAFAVAAAMIAGSLWFRARDGGDERDGAAPGGPLRVVCSEDVAAACDAVREAGHDARITVEAAGTTAARLSAAQGDAVEVDIWIVPGPWPEIVDGRRGRAQLPQLFGGAGEPVARSRLALVVWKERAAALAPSCASGITWRCLGEAAVRGTRVRPGLADPTTSATALLVLGHAVASYFGRADVSTIDLDADDGFGPWFEALVRSDPRLAGDPLPRMLSQGVSAYDAVGTTEANARAVVATAARRDRVDLLYPAPMATAGVVVAVAGGRRRGGVDEVREAAAAALRAAGWTARPGPDGLLSAGLLDALAQRWKEAR